MIWFVLGTMLAAGLVGGVINSFLSDHNTEKELNLWQYMLLGVGSAFVVPVFLNMISSQLISEIQGAAVDSVMLSKLLILGGFCLLAAISSRAFIKTITEKILKEVAEAKKEASEAKIQSERAEAIADLTVETDYSQLSDMPLEKGEADVLSANLHTGDTHPDEMKVLSAMVGSSFSMRSLSGISKDAGMDKFAVNNIIGKLLKKGWIEQGKNKEGQLRWYPTTEGRTILLMAHNAEGGEV